MLKGLGFRRRHRYSWRLCALASAILLLISVSLLYNRLSLNDSISKLQHSHYDYDLDAIQRNPLLFDTDDGSDSSSFDRIDELDFSEVEEEDEADDLDTGAILPSNKLFTSGYFFDHVSGVIRKALNKRSVEDWEYDYNGPEPFGQVLTNKEGSGVFGSDDVIIDVEVRDKIGLVERIEDALLLKIGSGSNVGLRAGWGDWFDKKFDFLRRDRMFRSTLEALNPLNNPMLQDPDGIGPTGLTRGDKAVRKFFLDQIRKSPPLLSNRRSLIIGLPDSEQESNIATSKLLWRKLLNTGRKGDDRISVRGRSLRSVRRREDDSSNIVANRFETQKKVKPQSNTIVHLYADGKRWGYFPGLDAKLTFSNFVASFFKRERCGLRVFMIWNSPSWMFGVRHQRGIESLLSIHGDACIVMLSESMELDFFKDSVVKKGYKVAVAMPNLNELLKDTPTYLFSSVWSQWRKTKFYPSHYSELVRLAVLYKYGGIYLDSDVIVLNPISSLKDTIGLADQDAGISLNGGVMAFIKRSPFIMECLKEFYSTYREDELAWNGAELLGRVSKRVSTGLTIQPSFTFFPISSKDVLSYFCTPANESERLKEDAIFDEIVNTSVTFHFWNSLTSYLVPEEGSLVARVIHRSCIFCHDSL